MARLTILHDLSSPLPEIPHNFVGAFLSRTQRQALLVRLRATEGRCAYCGDTIGRKGGSLDHLTPVSRGGADTVGNLVLCCKPCNDRKGPRTATEYVRDLVTAAIALRRRLRAQNAMA